MARAKNVLKIPVTCIRQHGTTFYLGALTKTVVNRLDVRVDTYESSSDAHSDESEDSGYQRLLSERRVSEIKDYINTNILPTSILVNFRFPISVEKGTDSRHAFLVVPEGSTAYIYDGQHREAAVKQSWDEGLEEFELGAVFTGFSKSDELFNFAVANSTSKSVDKTVGEMAKVKWSNSDPENNVKAMLPKSMRGDFGLLSPGYRIVRGMSREPNSPWLNKFRRPNSVAKKGVMDEGKVQKYFRCIIRNPSGLFSHSDAKNVEILQNYGTALKKKCPLSFDKQDEHLLLRHVGMEFLGRFLPILMTYILDNGGTGTVKDFSQAIDKMGEKMTDYFWHKDGPAKRYHGSSNVADLVNLVRRNYEIYA